MAFFSGQIVFSAEADRLDGFVVNIPSLLREGSGRVGLELLIIPVLEVHAIKCSMSRKGDCWDNAVAERFALGVF